MIPFVAFPGLPPAICSRCGRDRTFTHVYTDGDVPTICLQCLAVVKDGRHPAVSYRVLPTALDPEPVIRERLIRRGLSERDADCAIQQVPARILQLIPQEWLVKILAGGKIRTGLGLVGLPEQGKSGFLAALLKTNWANYLRISLQRWDFDWNYEDQFRWVNWLQWATRIQLDPWNESHVQLLDICKQIPVLVLDDLAREKVEDPRAAERIRAILTSLIDFRDGAHLPILWTSNLGVPALLEKYDAHHVRRLIHGNPAIELPPDMPTWSA
jgi:hypothetical protein